VCTSTRNRPEHIRALFRSISRTMPENNLRQAIFRRGPSYSPTRSARPGYRLEVEWKERKRFVVVMPGVPREMKPMLENGPAVDPQLGSEWARVP